MKAILGLGIALVIVVLAITTAIIAAAPYIAIGAVVAGLGWLAVNQGDDDPPSSGPPAVQ